MLYHLHEFQKVASVPAHQWSEATGLFLNAFSFEDSEIGRYFIAGNEMLERATRDFPKPNFNITTFNYTKSSRIFTGHVHEEIIIDTPFCNLLNFKRYDEDYEIYGKNHPNVLIVAPLSGHYSTLLRDTVRTFLPDHNVWITEWKNARDIPLSKGEFSLDDYVDTLLEYITYFRGNIHVIAVCQPVVPVLEAVSYLAMLESPFQPFSMTLMAGPVDASANPGKVNKFAIEHSIEWFKNNIIDKVPIHYLGAGRKVCPGFVMLNGFMALNIERHSEASYKLYLKLVEGDMETAENHKAFYDEYRSVIDIPAEYFLQSVETIFQNFDLPKGQMYFKGHLIKPELIEKTALLTIEGEKDDISCPGQTLAAQDLCKNLSKTKKDHYLQSGVGHYGVFNGHRFRESIYPKISSFIKLHNK